MTVLCCSQIFTWSDYHKSPFSKLFPISNTSLFCSTNSEVPLYMFQKYPSHGICRPIYAFWISLPNDSTWLPLVYHISPLECLRRTVKYVQRILLMWFRIAVLYSSSAFTSQPKRNKETIRNGCFHSMHYFIQISLKMTRMVRTWKTIRNVVGEFVEISRSLHRIHVIFVSFTV